MAPLRRVSLSLDLRPIVDSTPPFEAATPKRQCPGLLGATNWRRTADTVNGDGRGLFASAIDGKLRSRAAPANEKWWLCGAGRVTLLEIQHGAGREAHQREPQSLSHFEPQYVCNCSNNSGVLISFVTKQKQYQRPRKSLFTASQTFNLQHRCLHYLLQRGYCLPRRNSVHHGVIKKKMICAVSAKNLFKNSNKHPDREIGVASKLVSYKVPCLPFCGRFHE